jgi:NitT/TauT family transport system substrate-binding protein
VRGPAHGTGPTQGLPGINRQGEKMRANLLLKAACAAIVACLPAFAASAQTKVVAGIPSPIVPYMAGVVYAKDLGFYKEEGLEVEFVSVQGSGVLIPQIVNKAVTFGLIVPELPTLAIAKGEPYPLTFFYGGYPNFLWEFVVPENSPIKSLADMKGKKMGVGALAFGNIPISKAMLASQGVTWMKDVEVLPVGLGPAAWKRLTDGEIDLLNLFAHEHQRMVLSGIKLRWIPVPGGYDKLLSNSWITHSDNIKDNPKVIEGFGRAYAKGYYACTLDPEKCLRAFWRFDPASKPAADKEAEWIKTNLPVLMVDINKAMTGIDQSKMGAINPESIKQLVAALKAGEVIPSDQIDVSHLYTNSFIPKINDFDRAAVKATVQKAP